MSRSTHAEDLLSVKEVAGWLKVSQRTVWRWVAQGMFPVPVRLPSRRSRWRESELRQFIESRRTS